MITKTLPKELLKNKILLFLLLCYGTGFFIMAFLQTPENMAWYENLKHPFLTPPGYVFSIVWSVLYALIALSGVFIWQKANSTSKILFFSQLIGQIVWSFTFFYSHQILAGTGVLLLLWIIIALMIKSYYKISVLASYMLIPYLLWCIFATYLNLGTALIN
ncbi:MAG: tryptophan-rich sensory protein [Alphaproteobacteria bacterium]|nr:tryptophan-rich sensory protein [Alphaproteobacteria bacterium]